MKGTKSEKSKDIIIYTNRRRIMPMLIVSIICSIFFFIIIIFISFSLIMYPEQRNGGTIFALIEMVGFGAIGFWLIRSLIGLSTPGTPMLVINHEGIRVGTQTYGSTEFVFLWKEIEAIYMLGGTFCIRPTDKKQLFSRFHPIKRLLLRATFPKDIYVTQLYLRKPAKEVFREIQEKYAHELRTQGIQLHP